MDTKQIKALIADTLLWMDDCAENLNTPFYSADAVNLILGTIAVESDMAHFIEQIKGTALGITQMEGATHDDIINNFLTTDGELKTLIQRLVPLHSERLRYDLRYSIVFSRLHYYRVADAIPSTLAEQAQYWKKRYNTAQGKGTITNYLDKAKQYAIT